MRREVLTKKPTGRRPMAKAIHFDMRVLVDCPGSLVMVVFIMFFFFLLLFMFVVITLRLFLAGHLIVPLALIIVSKVFFDRL